MPRQTNRQYIETFLELNRLWSDQRTVFTVLTPTEQWHLHHYFRLSENLKASELVAHRVEITKQQPSLPQSAGRALAKLYAAMARPAPVHAAVGKGSGSRRVMVRPLVHPTVDVEQMARALRRAARDLEDQDKSKAA